MAARLHCFSLWVWLLLSLCACASEPTRLELPNPELASFAETAYPILLRDCGFPACHGNTDRFFRLFGPGRTRLDPEAASDEKASEAEVRESFSRAVSMLVHEGKLRDSLLLRKPLDTAAGGAGHEGEDWWGRNVYFSKDDPSYVELVRWAETRAGTRPSAKESAP